METGAPEPAHRRASCRSAAVANRRALHGRGGHGARRDVHQPRADRDQRRHGSGRRHARRGHSLPVPEVLSGVVGQVAKVTVALHGFHHTCAHDVDLLLVAPQGQESILMSDAGDCDVGSQQPPPIELGFDDSSSMPVPCLDGPSAAAGEPASTRPPTIPPRRTTARADDTHPDVFAAPAPAGPYLPGACRVRRQPLPTARGTSTRWISSADDSGAIDSGWSLDLTIPAGTLGSAPRRSREQRRAARTLTARSGALGNAAAPAYQWNRCAADGSSCTPIASATAGHPQAQPRRPRSHAHGHRDRRDVGWRKRSARLRAHEHRRSSPAVGGRVRSSPNPAAMVCASACARTCPAS